MDTWEDDPSGSIYYADKSLDLNDDYKNRDEFVNSHYIKALAYSSMDEYRKAISSLNVAYKYIQNEKYFYTNSNFYTFYIEVQFIRGQYSELSELLSNKSVVDILDERALLIFNLYKLKRDIIFERDNVTELIKNSISAGQNLEYKDVLGELYILYGDYLFESDLRKSRDFFQRALELGDERITVESLLKLGLIYREWKQYSRSLNFLERAYLSAEVLDNYKLTSNVLKELSTGYQIQSDYKNLGIIKERENHINKRRYDFLLQEQAEILDTSYLNEKLSDTVIKNNSRITIMYLIIISLSIIIVFLIVFISIQSYKLRVYKLGEH